MCGFLCNKLVGLLFCLQLHIVFILSFAVRAAMQHITAMQYITKLCCAVRHISTKSQSGLDCRTYKWGWHATSTSVASLRTTLPSKTERTGTVFWQNWWWFYLIICTLARYLPWTCRHYHRKDSLSVCKPLANRWHCNMVSYIKLYQYNYVAYTEIGFVVLF